MNDPWALWHDATGAAHVRPLFDGELRGHGYTGPLRGGEAKIEVPAGEWQTGWCAEHYWGKGNVQQSIPVVHFNK